jgi:hypothetical protein
MHGGLRRAGYRRPRRMSMPLVIAILAGMFFLLAGFPLLEGLRAVEARVISATPACQARWRITDNRHGRYHYYAPMPCTEAAAFAAQHDHRMTVEKGAVLVLQLTRGDAAGRTVSGFFPQRVVPNAIADGRIMVTYRPGPPVRLFAAPDADEAIAFAALYGVLLAGGGLAFWCCDWLLTA